jgi:hypothetical protein
MRFLHLALLCLAILLGSGSAMMGPVEKDYGFKRFRVDPVLEGSQHRESKSDLSCR